MRHVAVLVVALVACKGKEPPPLEPDHCLEAAERLGATHFEMSRPRAEEDELGARMSKLTEVMTKKCFDNKWPKEVTSCLTNMMNSSDAKYCWASLPDSADLDKTLDHYEHRGAQ